MMKLLAIGAVALASFTGATAQQAWGYEDTATQLGPDEWNQIAPVCGDGMTQSPIALTAGHLNESLRLTAHFVQANNTMLTNNGHTVELMFDLDHYTMDNNNWIIHPMTGEKYVMEQIHFHFDNTDAMKGSEHSLHAKKYPLEVHHVCFNQKYYNINDAINHNDTDGLLVLAQLYEESADPNQELAFLQESFMNVSMYNSVVTLDEPFNARLMTVLAEETNDVDVSGSAYPYWTYNGSLTTPTCNEIVTWVVLDDIADVSMAQLDYFDMFEMHAGSNATIEFNWRPLEAIKEHVVYQTFSTPSDAASAVAANAFVMMMMMALALMLQQ